MIGNIDSSTSDDYNAASFRDNLESILAGLTNDELKKTGIELKLVSELSSNLKIIDITFNSNPLKK